MESSRFNNFLRRWLVNTLGVMAAANIVNGISYDRLSGLLVASLLLGIFNAVLRPILILLTLPLVIFSFGLFTFVINGILVYAIGSVVTSFHVAGFWPAFWAGLVISIVSQLTNWLMGPPAAAKPAQPPPGPPRDEGGGPVIDV